MGRVSGPIDQPDHFDRTWSTRAGPRAAQSWQSFGKLRKSCDQPEGVRAAHHPLRMAASATDVPVDPLSLRCWSSQKGMEGSSPPPTQPLAHACGPSTRSSEQVERRSPAALRGAPIRSRPGFQDAWIWPGWAMMSSEPQSKRSASSPRNEQGARYVIAGEGGRAMSPTGDRRLTREQTSRKEPCR